MKKFLEKRGFYIVLALCVVVVGATALLLVTGNNNSNPNPNGQISQVVPTPIESDDTSDVAKKIDKQIGEITSPVPTVSDASSAETIKPQPTIPIIPTAVPTQLPLPPTSKPIEKPVTTPKPTVGETIFEMPVFGKITQEYAADKLIYSKTMDEWRTHMGVDIAANIGTPVKASAGGTVEKVYYDQRFGYTVIISHGDGIKTIYSNLNGESTIAEGTEVKKGSVIGSVGDSATVENIEATHLHFEIRKNDVSMNPATYIVALKNK